MIPISVCVCACVCDVERERENRTYIERGESPKFCIWSSKLNRGGSADGVDLFLF